MRRQRASPRRDSLPPATVGERSCSTRASGACSIRWSLTRSSRAPPIQLLDNLIEIRTTLESAIATRAARRITPDTAATLTRSFEQLASLLDQPAEYHAADLDFHDVIHRIAGDRFVGPSLRASRARRSARRCTPATRRRRDRDDHLAHVRIMSHHRRRCRRSGPRDARTHHGSWARRRPPTATVGVHRHPLTAPAVTPPAI